NSGFIVVGMGLVVSIIFHLTTREPVNARRLSRLHSNESTRELMHMTWKQWFLQPQFYQIGLLYMTSRLYCNISQVYFPFYITQTQKYDKKYVAIFPMTSYVASFAISTLFSFSFINRRLNRKAMFMFGGMCCMANCAWMYFSDLGLEMMYPISCLLGIGQAIVLVSSLDITADLINRNTESGAFVYGAMSLVDKFANGVAYQIIEIMNPSCDPSSGKHEACRIFYRNVMVFVPAACMLLGAFVLISLIPQNVGHRPAREGDHRSLLNDNSTIYEE
uniref:Uncharacterized protein n=1 Tax=Plectus sambesii TaxID=2011161 RepID=A0A914WJA5_9BILA